MFEHGTIARLALHLAGRCQSVLEQLDPDEHDASSDFSRATVERVDPTLLALLEQLEAGAIELSAVATILN